VFDTEYAGQYPEEVGANVGDPGAKEMEGNAVGASTELPE
jgi:hypothetical protein